RRSSASSTRAPYQSLPQLPTSLDAIVPSTLEEAEDVSGDEVEGDMVGHDHPPLDPRIRWIHFILGCAVLLPWNVLITATPFFLARLEGSSLRSLFSSYLSTSFTFSNFFFLAHATWSTKSASPSHTIQWATLHLAFLSFLLTLSTFFHVAPGLFAAFILLSGIAMAAAGSYLQTAVVAVASLFGPTVMQSVMSGQAAVAIVVSTVQLVSAAASLHTAGSSDLASTLAADDAAVRSARAFFALSTLFLIAAAGASAWMTRMSAYKAVVHPTHHAEHWARDLGEERVFLSENEEPSEPEPEVKGRIFNIARRNVIYEIAVAYVFVVTLAVYPPLTILVEPTTPGTHPLLFSSIHFLVFNTGDFLGRYLCSFKRLLIWSEKRLLVLSLSRTLFIPLFLACNIQRNPLEPSTPPLINSDLLFMLLLAASGMSNGYVSSMCMMSAPSLDHNPKLKGRKEDVDIAATVASFCLVGGLVVGSMASFGVRAAMCECNPF
ncbi:nucleoside transporter-domain-containing protein, partial [Amylostereum chailletii]